MGDDPFYLKFDIFFEILAFKNADFQSISARSASAVIPSEKAQLSLIGAFQ